MNLAHKLPTKAPAALALALTLALTLAACSTAPAQVDANNDGVRDTTERPRFFGRNAWDRKHASQTEQAQAEPSALVAQPAPITPPTPQPVQSAPTQMAAAAPQEAKPKKGIGALFSHPKAEATKARTEPQKPQAQPAPVQASTATPPPTTQPKPKRAPLFPWARAAEAGISPAKPARTTAPVVGGYGPATDKAAVEAAAAFALSEAPGYKFSAVYSAKVQVVAGTNYSLCLWVRRPAIEPNPFSRRMVAATIFQGLDRHYELVSWREVEHCRAGS